METGLQSAPDPGSKAVPGTCTTNPVSNHRGCHGGDALTGFTATPGSTQRHITPHYGRGYHSGTDVSTLGRAARVSQPSIFGH